MADAVVIALLLLAVFLAARSVYRQHKKGGGCMGNCEGCKGCGKKR